jgi:hypothetical protein
MYTPFVTRQNIVVPQTVPFSHQHHLGGVGLDCRCCYTGVEQSRYAGLPPTETCMTCHSQLWTNATVRESLAAGKPLRWQQHPQHQGADSLHGTLRQRLDGNGAAADGKAAGATVAGSTEPMNALAQVNAVLSVVHGTHYPTGAPQWQPLKQARGSFAGLVARRGA